MSTYISNAEDIIDSRDAINRLSELQEQVDAGEIDEDDDEYQDVLAFCEEGESTFPDWNDGVTLVRDSYFEEFAREFAEEIGAIEDMNVWPASCIDWEEAANDLQADYSPVDFDDVTYWGR